MEFVSKNLNIILLTICILTSNTIFCTNYKQILLPQSGSYSQQKCLDGSPQSIYIKENFKGVNPRKIMIFFQGGGWCMHHEGRQQTLEKCYERLSSRTGSSKLQKKQKEKGGIQSDDPQLNPTFYDYNIIYVNMCDSNGYQGHREKPLEYKDRKLWFRGKENVLAVLRYAKEHFELEKADTVVVTGSSAGGQAATYWLDFIAGDLNKNKQQNENKVNVLGIINNGLFRLDSFNHKENSLVFQNGLKQLANLVNAESDPIQESCVKANPNQKYRCLSFQENYKYIKSPLILVQSNIDTYLETLVGVDCIILEDQNFMEKCQANKHENTIINYNSISFNNLVSNMMLKKQNMSAFIIKQRVHSFITNNMYYNKPFAGVKNNTYFYNNQLDTQDHQIQYQQFTPATAIQKFIKLNQYQNQQQQSNQIRLIEQEYDLNPYQNSILVYIIIIIVQGIILIIIITAYVFIRKQNKNTIKQFKVKKSDQELEKSKIIKKNDSEFEQIKCQTEQTNEIVIEIEKSQDNTNNQEIISQRKIKIQDQQINFQSQKINAVFE